MRQAPIYTFCSESNRYKKQRICGSIVVYMYWSSRWLLQMGFVSSREGASRCGCSRWWGRWICEFWWSNFSTGKIHESEMLKLSFLVIHVMYATSILLIVYIASTSMCKDILFLYQLQIFKNQGSSIVKLQALISWHLIVTHLWTKPSPIYQDST